MQYSNIHFDLYEIIVKPSFICTASSFWTFEPGQDSQLDGFEDRKPSEVARKIREANTPSLSKHSVDGFTVTMSVEMLY